MRRKILIGIGALVLLAVTILVGSYVFNRLLSPPELVVNFVDLEKVEAISRYRSCYGHTVVPQDMREMRRNMKHYVLMYPEYKQEEVVAIYAPYDGSIAVIREDMQGLLEGEIWIAQDRGALSWMPPLGLWMVSFEHVRPREGLSLGDSVKAGEVVAYASFLVEERVEPTFDVIYGKMGIPPKRIDNWTSPFSDLDSIFFHMSDDVLAEYATRGITLDGIVISKEARDEAPCVYQGDGPYFTGDSGGLENWMPLE